MFLLRRRTRNKGQCEKMPSYGKSIAISRLPDHSDPFLKKRHSIPNTAAHFPLYGYLCRAHERDSKGTVFLWSGQGLKALAGFGAEPRDTKALRKGEFQKQSSGLFLKEGRPAREGVPATT